MRFQSCFILLLVMLAMLGCAKTPRPVRQIPTVPPKVMALIDPQLAASADRELDESLRSADPITRAQSLEAIKDVGGVKHNADILKALHDNESIVRFAAALATGELKIHQAHPTLLMMADDRSENVRVAVRFALHRIGDTHLSHDLEHMAADNDPRVRGNTAFVLGLLGDPSALKILRVLRTDAIPPVRQQASEAMWRLGDEVGLKDLVGLTFSRFPDDQIIGYLGLAWPKNTNVRQHVRNGLSSEEAKWSDEKWPEVRLVAARAMGLLASDEGYGIAQLGAASNDPRQRVLAALAFGAIRRPDAQDTLRKLLADADSNVRIAAATAILQLQSPRP